VPENRLVSTCGRILCATLLVAADFVAPTLGDTAQGWLFVGAGMIAGLLIARWWAVALASSMLLVSLTVSPGREDTQGSIFFLVGILGSLGQAVLICVGVSVVKTLAVLRRRRRAAH